MRTLAALALVFSAQAFACPQLTGSFTCTAQDGSKQVMKITQDMKGTTTVYNINGSDLPADKSVMNLPDDDSLKNATISAWCDDDVTLKAQILGKYYQDGSYFGDLTANLGFSMKGKDLAQHMTGDVKASSGDYPINSDTVCTAN